MQQCQVIKLLPCFDPNEWCTKNSLLSGGLNPGPFGHESSALPLDHGYSPSQVLKYLKMNFLLQIGLIMNPKIPNGDYSIFDFS